MGPYTGCSSTGIQMTGPRRLLSNLYAQVLIGIALGALLEHCRCFQFTYSDLGNAVSAFDQLVAAP